jgi:hypothetical protein
MRVTSAKKRVDVALRHNMRKNIDYVVCPICGVHKRALGNHIKKHNYTIDKFAYDYPNSLLICKDMSKKYSIKQSGQNNVASRTNMSEEKRKLKGIKGKKTKEKNGPLVAWNKGLTKETDNRVKNGAINTHRSRKKNKSGSKQWYLNKFGEKEGIVRYNKAHFHGKLKGKTYEEICGEEKGRKLRETRSRMIAERIINGKKGNKYFDGYYFSKINQEKKYYRSFYELAAYQLLDDQDAQTIIKSWEVEPFRIEYKNKNNETRNTVPDIFVEYLSGKKQLISVKPEKWLNDKDVKLKHKAMENWCKENGVVFSIWTDKELNIKKCYEDASMVIKKYKGKSLTIKRTKELLSCLS